MLCGVSCIDRNAWLEEQKSILNDPVIIDAETSFDDIKEYFANSRNVIWDEPSLYPESREHKLSFVPSEYHKTAIYFKPSQDELIESDNLITYMQFVAPSHLENFDCVLYYSKVK